LRFESLEQRSLLTIAAFSIHLYEDAGGAPGAPIADNTVEVGEAFYVEVMARELHPVRAGFQGIALDFQWDPAVLREADDVFDPQQIVTGDLPVFQRGTLDNDLGTIENLSGYAALAFDVGRPIGNLRPERFALLRFEAVAASDETAIEMNQGRSRIATRPVSSLGSRDIDFERQVIHVVESPAPLFQTPSVPEIEEADSGTIVDAPPSAADQFGALLQFVLPPSGGEQPPESTIDPPKGGTNIAASDPGSGYAPQLAGEPDAGPNSADGSRSMPATMTEPRSPDAPVEASAVDASEAAPISPTTEFHPQAPDSSNAKVADFDAWEPTPVALAPSDSATTERAAERQFSISSDDASASEDDLELVIPFPARLAATDAVFAQHEQSAAAVQADSDSIIRLAAHLVPVQRRRRAA
jgi:hypothetical protein